MSAESRRPKVWFTLSAAGATAAAALEITLLWLRADCNDALRREPLALFFIDPFVLMFAVPAVGIGTLTGFLIGNYWLDDTVVWKTATLTCGAVFAAILSSWNDPFSAAPIAFATMLAAAAISKLLFRMKAGR